MTKYILLIFLVVTLQASAQQLSSDDLLNKSIDYHDPADRWSSFKGILHIEQLNPKKMDQNTRVVHLDRQAQYFKMTQIMKDDTLVRSVDQSTCVNLFNGSPQIADEINAQYRMTCDRAKMYRDYYSYLYGLPMKLKDPGTLIDPNVMDTVFNKQSCWAIRVTYDISVGEDVWYFYFDKKTFALIGYRFYHDEDKNDGEHITLYGEEQIDGIKMPKNRFWYYNNDGNFLAADFLMPEASTNSNEKISLDNYDRAVSFLWSHVDNGLAYNLNIRPNWLADSSGLWYINHSEAGKEYRKWEFGSNDYRLLFNHDTLADKLNEMLNDSLKSNHLSLQDIKLISEDTLQFNYNGKKYRHEIINQHLWSVKDEEPENHLEKISPDGKWIAFTKDFNLYLRSTATGEEFQMSTEGGKDYAYGSYYGWFDKMIGENDDRPERTYFNWSPDSKYLQINIVDTRFADKMYLLDWSVDSLYRPRLLSYYRGSPGDTTMVHLIPVFYDIETKEEISTDLPRNTHINSIAFHWSNTEGKVFAQYADRGYQKERLELLDLPNGKKQTLIVETSDTNVEYFRVRYVEQQGKIVFVSERSGWSQIYVYDLSSGTTSPVTNGDFFVHGVPYIDQESQIIYFLAAGKEEGTNPYHQHFYKVDIDGKNLRLLTPEYGHHEISISKGKKYFFDNFSSASLPGISVLRSMEDGAIIQEIGKSDISELLRKGYRPPQSFEAIGRDGKTKIYGSLWKPSDFNPYKKYPLIDHSYTGPHTQMYPRSYRVALARSNQALAELGFVVMMVDGMGSSGRSKAFHNVSYRNMGKNLKGHVLAIEQLGKRFSWIDTDRVGIFGHSAGGYDAGHGVLEYPEVYKVAVASSADHDFRMEKAWWPEMYMGWPVDSLYHQVSNITMAGNLKGKLLLVHGGLDDNVNPSATFKLAEALVDADKEFDLLILPSQRHGYRDRQHGRYFTKKRWNYFVEHLLQQDPIWDIDWNN